MITKHYGYYQTCQCCEKVYYTLRKGTFVCSPTCEEILEQQFYKEQMEELESELGRLLYKLDANIITKEAFQVAWRMTLYEAKHLKLIHDEDIVIATQLAEKWYEEGLNETDMNVKKTPER